MEKGGSSTLASSGLIGSAGGLVLVVVGLTVVVVLVVGRDIGLLERAGPMHHALHFAAVVVGECFHRLMVVFVGFVVVLCGLLQIHLRMHWHTELTL